MIILSHSSFSATAIPKPATVLWRHRQFSRGVNGDIQTANDIYFFVLNFRKHNLFGNPQAVITPPVQKTEMITRENHESAVTPP